VSGLPCRRCGQVTDGQVVIYGPNETGALEAKTAQCRGPCGDTTPRTALRTRQLSRPREPEPASTFPAGRPGWCTLCPRDIQPGDVIVRLADGGGIAHLECSPALTPAPARERHRTRR
jgi:hypothetical protein